MLPVRRINKDFHPLPKTEKKPALTVIPGGGLELFTCKRQAGGLRLTKTGCAKLFKRSIHSDLDRHPHLSHCRSCPVGEKNSGLKNSASSLPKTCVRCNRPDIRRLDAKLLCISCGNRQREYISGKNARGCMPVRFIPLRLFKYDKKMTVIARDCTEALRVVSAMTAHSAKSESLIDLGEATPQEVGAWWRQVVLPWSQKHSHILDIKI